MTNETEYQRGYREGAEKMREDAAILLETKVPNFALPNGRLDRHPDGKNSPDSAQAKYSAAIRAIPITPPQPEARDDEREMREAFERWCEEPAQAVMQECGFSIKAWDAWQAAWNTRPQPAIEGDVVDRVAGAIFDLLSGDPEDDHKNPWVQSVAKAAIAAMQPTIDKARAEAKAEERARIRPRAGGDGATPSRHERRRRRK